MPRTYSEADARKVFARVAERQRSSGADTGGLSLADLEEAARAAGLDPTLVAAAAAELDAPETRRSLLGAPVEIVAQRVVRGTVSDEAWEAIVATARSEFGRPGTAGQLGRTREWTVVTGSRKVQATTRLALEPVGGDTRIVVTRSARDAALGLTIGGTIVSVMSVVFGTLFAAGVDPELWVPAVMMACMAVAVLGGTQVGLRAWHRSQSRRVEALLNRLELAARTSADHAPAAVPVTDVPVTDVPVTDVPVTDVPAARLDPTPFVDDEGRTDSRDTTARRTRT